MVRTTQEFVEDEGLYKLIEELGKIKQDEKQPHEMAEEYNINEDEVFELIWTLNDEFGPDKFGTITNDIFPVPRFNYRDVERTAGKFVNQNAPVEWEKLTERVADETGVAEEEVNRYLSVFEVTMNENRNVTAIELPR
jgi:hypothetical protein